jgi:hypothetical protein
MMTVHVRRETSYGAERVLLAAPSGPTPTLRGCSCSTRAAPRNTGGLERRLSRTHQRPDPRHAHDDFRADNGGSWQVSVDAGVLQQKLLVVTQGALAQSAKIDASIAAFAKLVAHHSDNTIAAIIQHEHIDEQVDETELITPPNPAHRVAGFSATFRNRLQRRGLPPANYDDIFRLYEQPAKYTNYGYWTWPSIEGVPHHIGYTTIPINGLAREPDGLEGIMQHEYLHHMDMRFEDAGIRNCYDPDSKPHGSAMTNLQFYEHIMRRQEHDGMPPPYGRLHGIFGKLG